MTSPKREWILDGIVSFVSWVGITLPVAYVLSIGLSDLSSYLARTEVVGWMMDFASILSVPWEMVATIVVIVRWRDLPQRFWILFCVNGFLAYTSLPIYLMHFGLYR
jgi:hypothetical protein